MARDKQPPVILADGCYVPEDLVHEGDVRSLYDKVFFYSELACDGCEKLDSRPRKCGGCDNFQGHYPLCSRRKLGQVVYWRLPRDAFWRLNRNFGLDLTRYPWEDWRSQEPFSPDFARLLRFNWKMLRKQQREVIELYLDKCWDSGLRGVLGAAPRTGKTVMTLALICAFGFRTIILANIKDLLGNFRKDAETFTNLLEVEEELGRKCMGIATNPEEFNSYEIVMATPNTFYDNSWGRNLLKTCTDDFGAMHIDEVHRAGAQQYTRIIDSFNVFNRAGVTATYFRKDNKHSVTRETVGPVLVEAKGDSMVPRVLVHDLRDVADCTPSRDDPKGYYYNKACQGNLEINRALVANVLADVKAGRKVLIPVVYKDHVVQLFKFFSALKLTVGVFIGGTSPPKGLKGCVLDRDKVVAMANAGEYDVVVGIRSIVGTGVNVLPWSSLHCVINTSNEYNMYQETKRVCTAMEGKPEPLLHFYLDASHKTARHLGHLYREVFKRYKYTMDEDVQALLHECTRAIGKTATEYNYRREYEAQVRREQPAAEAPVKRSAFAAMGLAPLVPKKKTGKLSVKAVTKVGKTTLETQPGSPVGNGLNW